MLEFLYPKEYQDSVHHIAYERLKKMGINNLIFDIDNTLAPFDVVEATAEIIALLDELKGKGFKICLLSNNGEQRVVRFNKILKLYAVHKAGKPGSRGIKKALALLEAKKDSTALIGDQIFTDVWCGNRQGLYTILVKPISVRDEFSVKLKRGIESVVVQSYVKKHGSNS